MEGLPRRERNDRDHRVSYILFTESGSSRGVREG